MYLLLAARQYMKTLLPFVKTIRAYYPVREFKKLIDRIEQTNRENFVALQQFEQQVNKIAPFNPAQKETLRRVAQLYEDCALLPFRTPPDRLNALGGLIDNFRDGTFVETDPQLVEALLSAPDDFNAQVGIVLHQHLPDLDREKREKLAAALEGLFHIRKQLNY